MNASTIESYTFDLDKIAPGHAYRRIPGIIDPLWNHGGREHSRGLLLRLRHEHVLFLQPETLHDVDATRHAERRVVEIV